MQKAQRTLSNERGDYSSEDLHLTMKICFLGDGAVGKTSLIRKYVYDIFDDSYLMTVGTKVTKKKLTVEMPDYNKTFNMTLMIWDIIGDIHFRGLLHHSYLYGASGAFIVCDVTRPETLGNLQQWVDSLLAQENGNIPFILMANKCDLIDANGYGKEGIESLAKKYNSSWLLTSAKSGTNVEQAFRVICKKMIRTFVRKPLHSPDES